VSETVESAADRFEAETVFQTVESAADESVCGTARSVSETVEAAVKLVETVFDAFEPSAVQHT